MIVRLARFTLDTPFGRFGTLKCDDSIATPWYTVERNLADPTHPCIPAGTYPLKLRYSPKRNYNVYGVEGVPGRTDIEIHVANRASELEGCIGLGMALGDINGEWAVLWSQHAFDTLLEALGGLPATLIVTDPCPSAL